MRNNRLRIFTENPFQMKKYLFLTLCLLAIVACKQEGDRNGSEENSRELIPDHDANPPMTTAQVLAIKNGLDQWDKVNEIAFTFNVDRGENHFERSWIWNPKTDDVTMIMAADTVAYNRKTMDSTHLGADASFINDKYWLLVPYQLVWDEGTTFTEAADVVAPISKDTLNRITILYGSEGGYTPGDAYDIFYSDDHVIKEWIFRKGNDSLPSMMTTFEDYEKFNGLNLAKTHKDSTGTFNLNFTNIRVK